MSGSKKSGLHTFRLSIFLLSMSTPIVSNPVLALTVASDRPTKPNPITEILSLLLSMAIRLPYATIPQEWAGLARKTSAKTRSLPRVLSRVWSAQPRCGLARRNCMPHTVACLHARRSCAASFLQAFGVWVFMTAHHACLRACLHAVCDPDLAPSHLVPACAAEPTPATRLAFRRAVVVFPPPHHHAYTSPSVLLLEISNESLMHAT